MRGGATVKRSVSLEELVECFRFGLKEAATHLGMCPTTLKRICRTHRVGRWPSRKKWARELEPALRRGGPACVANMMAATATRGAAGPRQATLRPAEVPTAKGRAAAVFCHHCGAALRLVGARFCQSCGTNLIVGAS